MQSKEIGENLLKQTPFGTRVEGVDVVMTIGKNCCRMDYTTALRLSAFLRHSGREARKNAGGGPVWTPFADLTDANAETVKARINKSRTIITGKVGD